jgi:HAD superfamily hydrolase (TIGR01509 family)
MAGTSGGCKMITLRNIKCAIFDVDGTLVDSMEAWDGCYEKYMIMRGLTPDPAHIEILRTISVDDAGIYLKEKYSLPDNAKDITAGFNKIITDFYMTEAEMKPYMLEILNAFDEKGVKLAVATASSEDIIIPLLTRLGIVDRFEKILTVRSIGIPKSRPEFFTHCISELDIDPENAVMFEDMPFASLSAKQAGLFAIGVNDRQTDKLKTELIQNTDLYLSTAEDYAKFIDEIRSSL